MCGPPTATQGSREGPAQLILNVKHLTLPVSHPGLTRMASGSWSLHLNSKYLNPCSLLPESSSGSFRVFLPFSQFHCHHKCKAIIMLKNNGLFITHDAKNGASRQPGHLKDERAQFTIKSGRRFHLRSIQGVWRWWPSLQGHPYLPPHPINSPS